MEGANLSVQLNDMTDSEDDEEIDSPQAELSYHGQVSPQSEALPVAVASNHPAALSQHSSWDPTISLDWDAVKPTEQCFLRIKRDIMSMYNDPPPGMFVVPDKDDMTVLHALITGPFETPYEGGLFYFYIRCPPDYPIRPPRVKLMTTGNGSVRFNPNLYKNGKVCLSILGTWSGPAWSPALSLSSLLMSIQSLMNEKPYHNEPGFEQERNSGDAQKYNDIIRHETLRVAVCGVMEQVLADHATDTDSQGTPNHSQGTTNHSQGTTNHSQGTTNQHSPPPSLREVMSKSFLDSYPWYLSQCDANRRLDGSLMSDPFGERRGTFYFSSIRRRLEALQTRVSESMDTNNDLSDSDISD